MNNKKTWIRKNGSTLILVTLFIIILVNKDAKVWLMRQMVSTGIFNSSIKPEKETSAEKIKNNVDFEVINEKGILIKIAQLKGKVVFINFWASWCPPCRAEFPSIQKFYNLYRNNPEIVFLTVNLDDDPLPGVNYLKDNNFTIPFLRPSGNIPDELFNGSLPTTVVLDKQGKIRLHHSGMADYSKASFYKQIDQLLSE